MTIEIHQLRGIWVGVEPAGSYGVQFPLSFPSAFLAFPFMEGSLEWKQMTSMLDPKPAKLKLDGHSKKIPGRKSATLKFDAALHSHGLSLAGVTAAPTATTWALFRLLKTMLGGSIARGNTGATVVAAGTTTTVLNVTTGRGVDFAQNGVVAVPLVSGGPLEAREIASVAGDAITVKQAFSAVPATGGSVYGGVTFFPTEDPADSLQCVIEGAENDNRIGLYGLQGGLKISVPIASDTDMPKLTFDLKGQVSARLAAQAAQALAYTLFEPMDGVASELTVPAFGSAQARTLVDDSAFSMDIALNYGPITSGAAAQNIKRMRRQATRPLVKGTFTTPNEDNTWYTLRDNKTDLTLFKQIGNLPGATWLISVSRIQVTDVQDGPTTTEASGQVVSFEGRRDAIDSTDIGGAAVRIHCL